MALTWCAPSEEDERQTALRDHSCATRVWSCLVHLTQASSSAYPSDKVSSSAVLQLVCGTPCFGPKHTHTRTHTHTHTRHTPTHKTHTHTRTHTSTVLLRPFLFLPFYTHLRNVNKLWTPTHFSISWEYVHTMPTTPWWQLYFQHGKCDSREQD